MSFFKHGTEINHDVRNTLLLNKILIIIKINFILKKLFCPKYKMNYITWDKHGLRIRGIKKYFVVLKIQYSNKNTIKIKKIKVFGYVF